MLDPKYLRNDIEQTAARLKTRGFELDVDAYNQMEEKRKSLQIRTQELQNERKVKSKSIGKAKASGENVDEIMAEVNQLKEDVQAAEHELSALLSEINIFSQNVPNLPHESVPTGADESENLEVSKWGSLVCLILKSRITLMFPLVWQRGWTLRQQLN